MSFFCRTKKTMQTFTFKINPQIYPLDRMSEVPAPYFVSLSPPAAAAAAAAAADSVLYSLQQKLKEPNQLFNPYFYAADDSFELGPKHCAIIYFEQSFDYTAQCTGLKSCLINQHLCFILHNKSPVNRLMIPSGARLLDILILPDIKSYLMPVKHTTDK